MFLFSYIYIQTGPAPESYSPNYLFLLISHSALRRVSRRLVAWWHSRCLGVAGVDLSNLCLLLSLVVAIVFWIEFGIGRQFWGFLFFWSREESRGRLELNAKVSAGALVHIIDEQLIITVQSARWYRENETKQHAREPKPPFPPPRRRPQ